MLDDGFEPSDPKDGGRMPARYILGVGDSDSMDAAEAWAESHASLAGVPLVRVHVGGANTDGATLRAAGHAASDLVHVIGPVPEALARFVRDEDILVIGTGKTGFIRGRVFGTLSLQISAGVRCTVAVVPQVDLRFRTGVVAGVEDDDLLPLIVHAAADEARIRNESLMLVHSSFAGLVPDPIETRGPVLDYAVSVAAGSEPGVKARTRETARPPAEALLDASRNASLLVVGAGRPRGAGHALGSVTHDVLVNINAPVLIVRPSPVNRADS